MARKLKPPHAKRKVPDKEAPPGMAYCRECRELQPLHDCQNSICWGCYAIVEIDRHMGIKKYRELEMYTTASGDPLGGHATRKPRTGLAHLDARPIRVADYGEVLYGGKRPAWQPDVAIERANVEKK